MLLKFAGMLHLFSEGDAVLSPLGPSDVAVEQH